MGKLSKPAQIGATIFDTGVEERLVIDRAQREYEHRTNPPCQPRETKQQYTCMACHDTGRMNSDGTCCIFCDA